MALLNIRFSCTCVPTAPHALEQYRTPWDPYPQPARRGHARAPGTPNNPNRTSFGTLMGSIAPPNTFF